MMVQFYIARKLGDGCTSSHGKHVDDEPSDSASVLIAPPTADTIDVVIQVGKNA